MKLSCLLDNQNINSQLVAFFNTRILKEDFKQGFNIQAKYKLSKFYKIDEKMQYNLALQTNENLIHYFSLPFECKKFGLHFVRIENDLSLELDEYFNALYANIMALFYQNYEEVKFEKQLLNAIFALNGSADFNRNLYAVDINAKYCTKNYFSKYFKLVLNLKPALLNLNFRELQPDYYQFNKKRAMQFRANLNYVKENLENLNIYKINILKKNKEKIQTIFLERENKNTLLNRFDFYSKFILKKSAVNVDDLRRRLDFDDNIEQNYKNQRKNNIITMARNLLPDLCAACSKIYDIKDRSFKMKNGFYYLELHHNIAFAYSNECDELDNLVKLCPTCHRALGKNRADENYQKELIKNILDFSSDAKEFAKIISKSDNDEKLIDFIFEALR